MTARRAFITGITGQDGSYLAEYLLQQGYEVHGLVRRSSSNNLSRLIGIKGEITLHYGDMTDYASLRTALLAAKPDEVYNLAAQSHVLMSFATPEYTSAVNGEAVIKLLEVLRSDTTLRHVQFYQASTSELYGDVRETPQTENTPFYPRSPYGAAKLFAYWATVNYREAYGMYACNGILFNHESPRRADNFVSQKIVKGMQRIHDEEGRRGEPEPLVLGNLDARRDWGHAKDYVRAMHMMLQQPEPQDYVIATGVTHTVREFVQAVANCHGTKIRWEGTGTEEVGIVVSSQAPLLDEVIVQVSPEFYRPAEVHTLQGDSTKARKALGWRPEYNFDRLVEDMVVAVCAGHA